MPTQANITRGRHVDRFGVFGWLAAATIALSACGGSFKLSEPPPRYAVVNGGHGGANNYLRAKASDDVGLNITTFHNVKGGTLDYWGTELTAKLSRRGYELIRHAAVRSKNGVTGTRFDFRYVPASAAALQPTSEGQPTSESHEKFYTAILFVTDRHRVVVQFAGDAHKAKEHAAAIEALSEQIKIRGCASASSICEGTQPKLAAPKPEKEPPTQEPPTLASDTKPDTKADTPETAPPAGD